MPWRLQDLDRLAEQIGKRSLCCRADEPVGAGQGRLERHTHEPKVGKICSKA
jgi:hypothetical protein